MLLAYEEDLIANPAWSPANIVTSNLADPEAITARSQSTRGCRYIDFKKFMFRIGRHYALKHTTALYVKTFSTCLGVSPPSVDVPLRTPPPPPSPAGEKSEIQPKKFHADDVALQKSVQGL